MRGSSQVGSLSSSQAPCPLTSPAPDLLITEGCACSGRTQVELLPRQDVWNKVPDTEAEVFISVQGAQGRTGSWGDTEGAVGDGSSRACLGTVAGGAGSAHVG